MGSMICLAFIHGAYTNMNFRAIQMWYKSKNRQIYQLQVEIQPFFKQYVNINKIIQSPQPDTNVGITPSKYGF